MHADYTSRLALAQLRQGRGLQAQIHALVASSGTLSHENVLQAKRRDGRRKVDYVSLSLRMFGDLYDVDDVAEEGEVGGVHQDGDVLLQRLLQDEDMDPESAAVIRELLLQQQQQQAQSGSKAKARPGRKRRAVEAGGEEEDEEVDRDPLGLGRAAEMDEDYEDDKSSKRRRTSSGSISAGQQILICVYMWSMEYDVHDMSGVLLRYRSFLFALHRSFMCECATLINLEMCVCVSVLQVEGEDEVEGAGMRGEGEAVDEEVDEDASGLSAVTTKMMMAMTIMMRTAKAIVTLPTATKTTAGTAATRRRMMRVLALGLKSLAARRTRKRTM